MLEKGPSSFDESDLVKKIIEDEKEHEYGETDRDIRDYSQTLSFESKDEFIKLISGKSVLDVGSGAGGLAKNVAREQVDSSIYSLNPRLASRFFRNAEKRSTLGTSDIQSAHDERAVAGIAQKLPYQDETFDVILDNYAVFHYVRSYEEFRRAISEMLRVLKPGGLMRLGSDIIFEEQMDIGREVLDDLGINYRIISDQFEWGEAFRGIEIIKT